MTRDDAGRLLHAYVDGELDSARSLELERHLAESPALRAACERLRDLSAAIREKADYYPVPASLAERLRASVPAAPAESAPHLRWPQWLRPVTALAAVAVLVWIAAAGVMRPSENEQIAREVLASHVRATLSDRLYDVVSSDQHTVKPWLSSRLAFSPPVPDLSASGFELLGARPDYIGRQPVAVLVYQRRRHRIDVFIWPADSQSATQTLTRDGFNIERFARNGMNFWLISDLNRNELNDLAALLADRSAAP